MAGGSKRLKNCIIAVSDSLLPADRDKIKGWVEHNGGKVSRTISDTVTHYIISKREWDDYRNRPVVQEARRKRTIYLMRKRWIADSLTPLNKSKSKPMNECNSKYTWELSHAKKVILHRRAKKAEKRRGEATARRLAAKEEQERSGESNDDMEMGDVCEGTEAAGATGPASEDENGNDSTAEKTNPKIRNVPGKKTNAESGSEPVRKSHKDKLAERLQQVFECGIKFDRSILETERNMALAGYRPYVDSTDRVHLIMLIRNDIRKLVQEQWHLKSLPEFVALSQDNIDDNPGPVESFAQRRRDRPDGSESKFQAGKNTRLRYLEDPICCNRSRAHHHSRNSIDRLNDGQCTPVSRDNDDLPHFNQPNQSFDHLDRSITASHTSQQIDPALPFSFLPNIPYTPFSSNTSPNIRVPLPQPFAYTLQMYESSSRSPTPIDTEASVSSTSSSLVAIESLSARPNSPSNDDCLTSFTEYLPCSADSNNLTTSPTPSGPSTAVSTAKPNTGISQPHGIVTARAPPEKTYTVIAQYTRKGNSRASEVETLAPEGSEFQYAIDVFKRFFRKKTGLSWEDVNGNGTVKHDGGKCSDAEESRDRDRDVVTVKKQDDNNKHTEMVKDSDNINDVDTILQGTETDLIGLTVDGTTVSEEPTDLNNDKVLPFDTNTNTAPVNASVSPDTQSYARGIATPATDTDKPRTSASTKIDNSVPVPMSAEVTNILSIHPFTYVKTDRKTYQEGNDKYKAMYGEDLFVFRHE